MAAEAPLPVRGAVPVEDAVAVEAAAAASRPPVEPLPLREAGARPPRPSSRRRLLRQPSRAGRSPTPPSSRRRVRPRTGAAVRSAGRTARRLADTHPTGESGQVMANFSAADVKRLRELTGAGMMDCKNALDGERRRLRQGRRVPAGQGPQGRHQARGPRRRPTAWSPAHVGGRRRHPRRDQLRDRLRRQGREVHGARRAGPRPGRHGRGRRTSRRCWRASSTPARPSQAAHRRGQRDDRREDRGPPGGARGGPVRRELPAPHQPRPAAADRRPRRHRRRPSDVARDVAMHIAAMSPDVPHPRRRPRRRRRRPSGASPRRPPARRASPSRPCPGSSRAGSNGFFKDNVLLEQAFAKDNKKTVQQVLTEAGRHRHRVRPVPRRRLSRPAAVAPESQGATAAALCPAGPMARRSPRRRAVPRDPIGRSAADWPADAQATTHAETGGRRQEWT